MSNKCMNCSEYPCDKEIEIECKYRAKHRSVIKNSTYIDFYEREDYENE
nr:MAG TPA: hypothetical protein [Bacteriophage sp.]